MPRKYTRKTPSKTETKTTAVKSTTRPVVQDYDLLVYDIVKTMVEGSVSMGAVPSDEACVGMVKSAKRILKEIVDV